MNTIFDAHGVLHTALFTYLLCCLDAKQGVVLKGPKGIGKSHSLIGVMAVYSKVNKLCVLLTQESVTRAQKQATLSYLMDLQRCYCELIKAIIVKVLRTIVKWLPVYIIYGVYNVNTTGRLYCGLIY